MLWNYLSMAMRQIKRNKLLSAINILGLSISLSACLLLLLFIQKELSFDKFWSNAENIYQVKLAAPWPGMPNRVIPYFSRTDVTEGIRQYYPEIEEMSFVSTSRETFKIGERSFTEVFSRTEPSIIKMFDFNVLEGNLAASLQDPNSVALSRKTAAKFFGNDPAFGQIITTTISEELVLYKVGAIYEDHSPNTIMRFDGLINLDPNTLYSHEELPSGGTRTSIFGVGRVFFKAPTAFLRNPLADPPLFINPYKRPVTKDAKFTPILLSDIHMSPRDNVGKTTLTPMERLTILLIITLAVLFMACINFINLSTARASQRAKEVALRKLHGANRSQIIAQFLGEAVAIVICSLVLAIALSEIMLPILNQYMAISMVSSYTDLQTIVAITAIILVVGLGSGYYPALVISSYLPIQSLRASPSNSKSGSPKLRKFLIILQFTISTCLIVVTTALYSQIVYSSKMDFGYNPSNLIQIAGAKTAFELEAAKLESIGDTSLSSMRIMTGNSSGTSIRLPNSEAYINISFDQLDSNFLRTFQVELLAGRGFQHSDTKLPNEKPTVIINEAARKLIGYETPQESIGGVFIIGKTTEATIIGVIPDLIIKSMQRAVKPYMYYVTNPKGHSFFTGRYTGDETVAIAELKALWETMYPSRSFRYLIPEDSISDQFRDQQQQMTALAIVSSLAIFIACLGLYGLATFTADQRTKEIGIRKVLGASTRQIIQLLIWQFSKPILLAIAIASPIAWYVSQGMLEKFTYHYDIVWLGAICLCVGLLTILVAWLTVASQAALIARANPVNALRDE